ncbi:MAG: sugar ABC transporter permease [Armatimonadetes bacterium]|nr:sugar ABC transporter permease [Armatimonadota bacterium]
MTPAERRRLRKGLAFASPWLIGLGVFLLYPILASLYFSFCEYSVLQKPVWIGAGNYQDLATDSVFWKTLGNTVVYAAFALPLGLVVSLSLAFLLNTGVKGLAVFRTIMFLPALVPMVALAIVWLWIFNGQYGLLNNLLRPSQIYWVLYLGYALPIAGVVAAWVYDRLSLLWGASRSWAAWLTAGSTAAVIIALLHPEAGLFAFVLGERFHALRGGPPGWLADPAWAKSALVVMSLWGGGNAMVIYLAGLQDVPQHLYDAAELDGANWLQKIRHVALPAISPVILFNLIMGIIGSLQFFAVPYVISPTGSPDRSIYFLTMYLYDNAFTYLRMGYASAMAWVLFLIVFALTMLALRLSRRFVYYEGG